MICQFLSKLDVTQGNIFQIFASFKMNGVLRMVRTLQLSSLTAAVRNHLEPLYRF